MTKTWEAPKLVVLVRARPEESILINCKFWQESSGGPIASDWWCWNGNEPCYRCEADTQS